MRPPGIVCAEAGAGKVILVGPRAMAFARSQPSVAEAEKVPPFTAIPHTSARFFSAKTKGRLRLTRGAKRAHRREALTYRIDWRNHTSTAVILKTDAGGIEAEANQARAASIHFARPIGSDV